MGWNATNVAQATALDQVLRSQMPGMLLRPVVFMTVLGAAWAAGRPLSMEAVIALYLAIAVLMSFVQLRLVGPFFSFMKGVVPDITGWQRWITGGLMLAPGRLLTDRLKDVLVLISGVPLGVVGVAHIAVALSIVNFLNFTITAVDTSFAPKTARSLTRGLADGLAPRQMRRTTHFIAVSGILKMGMLALGAMMLWLLMTPLMRLYGPDYADTAPVIWWFVLMPLANAFFGNTALVMQIFDRRADFLMTSLLALAALPLVGIYGVPAAIAAGADPLVATAACFALTMLALQALRWVLCLWRTGIDTSFPGALIRRQLQKPGPSE
jgi:hypothetical protein